MEKDVIIVNAFLNTKKVEHNLFLYNCIKMKNIIKLNLTKN